MEKYRTKQTIVEVIKWTGDNEKELNEFGAHGNFDLLPVGVYIVKNPKGEIVVYTKETFHELYERHLVWDENI